MKPIHTFLSFTLAAGLAAPALAASNITAPELNGGTLIAAPVRPRVDLATKQGKSITDPNDAYIGNQLLIHDMKSDTFGKAQFGGEWKTNYVLWAYKAGTAAAPNDTVIADAWFTAQGKVWNHALGTASHPLVDMWTRAVARQVGRSIEAKVYWNGKLEESWASESSLALPSWSKTKTVAYNKEIGLDDLGVGIPVDEGVDVKFDTTGVLTLPLNIQVTNNRLAFVASPRANIKMIATGSMDVLAAYATVSGSIDPLVDITFPANAAFTWTRAGEQATAEWSTNLAYTLAYLKGSLKVKGAYYTGIGEEDKHPFDKVFWDSVGYTQGETLIDLSHTRTF